MPQIFKYIIQSSIKAQHGKDVKAAELLLPFSFELKFAITVDVCTFWDVSFDFYQKTIEGCLRLICKCFSKNN